MDNPSFPDDVAARWRPLTTAEQVTVETWLGDAWLMLQVDSPGIVARIAAATVDLGLVIATLAEAVARKGRNADGKRQESITIDDATRSWTLDSSVSGGELYFTVAELSRLAGVGGNIGRSTSAFSVMPL